MRFEQLIFRQPLFYLVMFAAVLVFPLPALVVLVLPLAFLFFQGIKPQPVEVKTYRPRTVSHRKQTPPRAPPY